MKIVFPRARVVFLRDFCRNGRKRRDSPSKGLFDCLIDCRNYFGVDDVQGGTCHIHGSGYGPVSCEGGAPAEPESLPTPIRGSSGASPSPRRPILGTFEESVTRARLGPWMTSVVEEPRGGTAMRAPRPG